MPSFVKLLEQTRLIVLRASTEEDALNFAKAKRGTERPLWQWKQGTGLVEIDPGESGDSGLYPDSMTKAISEFQRFPSEAVLVVPGLTGEERVGSLRTRLAQQIEGVVDDREIQTWIVFIVTTERQHEFLENVFRELDADLASISAEALATQPSPKKAGRRPTPSELDLDDIGDLDLFDTPEWTEYLNHFPVEQLDRLCKERQDLIDESIDRLKLLSGDIGKVLVGKDKIIELMIQCSIAHLPLLLLGTWGTGKSMLVREFSKGLGIEPHTRKINSEDELVAQLERDAQHNGGEDSASGRAALLAAEGSRHFEYLVTRFTTPEELLGPVHIDLMLSRAIYLRQTHALLPRAEIGFLDEVFKANSSILNALLSIINERLFYNAGVPWTVNLVMLFAASNEPPQEEDLGAFYDRFPVRVLCDPVNNDELEDLLKFAHLQQYLSTATTANDSDDGPHAMRRMRQRACVNDFRLLRKVSLYNFGGANLTSEDDSRSADADKSATKGSTVRKLGDDSKAFLEKYKSLLRNLRREYDISDRSAAHFYRLARARALFESREELNETDCEVLKYAGKSEDALRQLPTIISEVI